MADVETGVVEHGLRRHLDVIERVTGHAPPTCPWRAYSDPFVAEVMSHTWAVEHGNLGVTLGEDPPAVLVDGIRAYRMALLSTQAEDRRIARDEAEQKRRSRGS